jgi:hypothetical protein
VTAAAEGARIPPRNGLADGLCVFLLDEVSAGAERHMGPVGYILLHPGDACVTHQRARGEAQEQHRNGRFWHLDKAKVT